jgi:hypothetical protein
VERATGNAGVMAYRILSDVYAWFGFNSAEMPYVDRNGESPKIDLAQIR